MRRKKVPVKTSKGTQEIKARGLGLAPRIRTALLLVDGIRSVTELERLMTAAGVTPGALQLLLDKGLIRFHEEEPELEKAVVEALPEAGNSIPIPTIMIPAPGFVETPLVLAPAEGSATAEAATTIVAADASPPTAQKTPEIPDAAAQAASALPAVEAEPTPEITPPPPTPMSAPQVAVAMQIKPAAAVEVVTLLELEAILGDVTKVEMEAILHVATKLELTPTQAMVTKTAFKEPSAQQAAPVTHDYWTPGTVKRVIPAAVLRMNLMAARAHLANALDLYLEVEGYALKQKVVACESRAELEQLFLLVENTLKQRIDKAGAAIVMDIARDLLER
jgi:hypothetical protein